MAARGGTRKSLTELLDAVGDKSPIDGNETNLLPAASPAPPTSAPLDALVANPRNPRDDLGDLSELESILKLQLQPALVVTRGAYLGLYPEDEPKLGAAQWVVINGCRRLAAARRYGRPDLEFVVKDEVAASRVILLGAAITENVARQGFDVVEEARAVEAMVAECGSAEIAARELDRSEGWVSQRRALLKLAPELQAALRRGDLAVRVARTLAKVPLEAQVEKWLASRDKPKDADFERKPKELGPVGPAQIAKALKKFGAEPDTLAEAITDYLDNDQLRKLVDSLTATLAPTQE
ncbi:ParB/RepB/Spo0J family partition protein [Nocardia sp. NPDC004151]|uniref:ParB/RepB/Spo0J family partition protein n=1 Tax=Nocardia sp. NPDC004151 TaxID=3364304 RepID=UPI0036A07B1C